MLRNIFSMLWKVWILSHPNSYKSQRQDNMSFNCYMHLHWNASLKQWYSLTSMFHFFAIALLMQLSCDLNGMKQNSKQFCLQLYSQVACKHKAHFFCIEFHQDIQRKDSKKAKHQSFLKISLFIGKSISDPLPGTEPNMMTHQSNSPLFFIAMFTSNGEQRVRKLKMDLQK